MNPLFVEVGALHLAEDPVLQASLAAQSCQPGNKDGQWAQRDHGDDHHKGNGGQLKGHRVRTTVEDLINGYLRFRWSGTTSASSRTKLNRSFL
jgi:hypothetical protein